MALAMVGGLIIMLGGIAGAGRFTYTGTGKILVLKYMFCGPNLLVTIGATATIIGSIKELLG